MLFIRLLTFLILPGFRSSNILKVGFEVFTAVSVKTDIFNYVTELAFEIVRDAG